MTSHNFIDANVIIYANTGSDRTQGARDVIASATHTDSLVLAEAFSKLRTIMKDHSRAQKAIKQLLATVDVVPVDRNVVFNAMKITDLDIFDAIHAVCAKGMTLKTYDAQLAEAVGTQAIK